MPLFCNNAPVQHHIRRLLMPDWRIQIRHLTNQNKTKIYHIHEYNEKEIYDEKTTHERDSRDSYTSSSGHSYFNEDSSYNNDDEPLPPYARIFLQQ